MMNLGKYIFGFRDEYLNKVSETERAEQTYSYNMLSLMFLVLITLCIVAGIVYGLVIFQNWIFAIICGLLLGGVSFILLLLVFFINMTTRHAELYQKMTNMKEVFAEYDDHDFTDISDEMALQITQQKKMELRDRNQVTETPKFHASNIITTTIKVTLVLVLSCLIANGIEIFMFKNLINADIAEIRNSETIKKVASINNDSLNYLEGKNTLAKWTLDVVTEKETTFKMIDSYSILLTLETLDRGLGNWKLLLDFLFALLFLVPFILVRKSKRYSGGVFLKEVALSDIATSLMFYILAQRKCQQVKQIITKDYMYDTYIKVSKDVNQG